MNPRLYKKSKIYNKLEQNANRSVVEFTNRLEPFSPEQKRRTVLDISPGNHHNSHCLLWLGYYVVALKDEKADSKALQHLYEVRDALNAYEKMIAEQQKRPINPENTREFELVDRLPEREFDGIIAIHTLIDLSPIKLRYLVDYINDHTKTRGYLALTTRTTQQNQFPKWTNIPDWQTKYTGKEEKRKTESLNCAMILEQLLRKPRR